MGCCTDQAEDEDGINEETKLQHDPEFRGPVSKRSCTDVICFLLFLLFIIGWIFIFSFACWNGDPSVLMLPMDTEGRLCGRDAGVENKTHLFFFDLTQCGIKSILSGCSTYQVCVERCPTDKWFFNSSQSDVSKLICKMHTDLNTSVSDLVQSQQCALYYVPSYEIAGRCFPKNLDSHVVDIFNSHKEIYGLDNFESLEALVKNINYVIRYALIQQLLGNAAMDVMAVWKEILVGFVAAMLVSFLYIMTLRIIAAVLIYFSMVAFIIIAGYGCYYTMHNYLAIKGIEKNMTEIIYSFSAEDNVKSGLTYLGEKETTWLVLFIIILTVLLVVLLILIFLRKRINIAIALIGQASKAVANITSSLFFPIIPFILQLLIFIFFCYTAILLESICTDEKFNSTSYQELQELNQPIQQELNQITQTTQQPTQQELIQTTQKELIQTTQQELNQTSQQELNQTSKQEFNQTSQQELNQTIHQESNSVPYPYLNLNCHNVAPYISYLQFYNVFGLFWSMFFISAFGEMVLAGAFASWYWSLDKSKDVPTFTIIHSLGRTLRYHVGTIAFGSLIIAIVRMIRTIMEYIDYKVRRHTDSKIVKFLMWCCRCCLWCLEKFLKYINRNAYIYCAIYGKNFCTSARKAVSLIFRNVARAVVLDKVTDFLLFIGKMVICSGMAAASLLIFNGDLKVLSEYKSIINYYQTPVAVITIGTYFIASSFFSVYDMAVDTVFLCFLEDTERNDGSSDKPYYMSKDLMKILDKKNEEEERELEKYS